MLLITLSDICLSSRHIGTYPSEPSLRDGGPVFGPQFRQGVLCHLRPLLAILQVMLHFTVLGQVDGGNLLLNTMKYTYVNLTEYESSSI